MFDGYASPFKAYIVKPKGVQEIITLCHKYNVQFDIKVAHRVIVINFDEVRANGGFNGFVGAVEEVRREGSWSVEYN